MLVGIAKKSPNNQGEHENRFGKTRCHFSFFIALGVSLRRLLKRTWRGPVASDLLDHRLVLELCKGRNHN